MKIILKLHLFLQSASGKCLNVKNVSRIAADSTMICHDCHVFPAALSSSWNWNKKAIKHKRFSIKNSMNCFLRVRVSAEFKGISCFKVTVVYWASFRQRLQKAQKMVNYIYSYSCSECVRGLNEIVEVFYTVGLVSKSNS